jgi:hypothetical protein
MRKRISLVIVLIVACVQIRCGGTSPGNGGTNPPPGIAVSIAPLSANVRLDASQQFTPTVTGTSNTSVN